MLGVIVMKRRIAHFERNCYYSIILSFYLKTRCSNTNVVCIKRLIHKIRLMYYTLDPERK